MKVLIADDDSVSRRLLGQSLAKWGYEVTAAHDGSEAWRILETQDAPALVILDWMMPGVDGVELCRKLRGRTDRAYVYILLLTTRSDKSDILEALEAGADDYLTKPFDLQELQLRLRAGKRVLEFQEALLEAREELRYQATHDTLTGVWNRRAILEFLEAETARANREGAALGVVMVDVDLFKRINDTRGHLAGDAVLRELARRLSEAIRSYDRVGRYGGEEFVAVLPGCDGRKLMRLAERLRRMVSANPLEISGERISVTVSVGAATREEGLEAVDPQSLVTRADSALYRAKAQGRNCTCLEDVPLVPPVAPEESVGSLAT